MVMPEAAELCPQCAADVGAAATRCPNCGFLLAAAPAPRTGPPQPRPVRQREAGQRGLLPVLLVGGLVTLGLGISGAIVWFRQGPPAVAAAVASVAPTPSSTDRDELGVEPSRTLSEARKLADSWRNDALLVTISAGPLTAKGVAPDGRAEFAYAQPSVRKITAGTEVAPERFVVRSSDGATTSAEERGDKAYSVPEPNCAFEDAWLAVQRSGVVIAPGLGLRYAWSPRHARPVWETTGSAGEPLRTLDGVTCSILTR